MSAGLHELSGRVHRGQQSLGVWGVRVVQQGLEQPVAGQ